MALQTKHRGQPTSSLRLQGLQRLEIQKHFRSLELAWEDSRKSQLVGDEQMNA